MDDFLFFILIFYFKGMITKRLGFLELFDNVRPAAAAHTRGTTRIHNTNYVGLAMN